MQRRKFIATTAATLIGGSLVEVARAAIAKPSIGFVSGLDAAGARDFLEALRDGLASLGYREPSGLTIEARYANNALSSVSSLVEQVERRGSDVIVTHGSATAAVVRGAHRRPVVYQTSADPVSAGLAQDLAHPLYNATGITLMAAELNAKRIELLHEIMPRIHRIAILANPLHPGQQLERKVAETAMQRLDKTVDFFPTPDPAALRAALQGLAGRPPEALLVFSDGFMVDHRREVIDTATRWRVPVISGWAVMARSGALFTYGPRLQDAYRRPAYFVDRILKGAHAADLPIERPAAVEFILNLRTARALGLAIPGSVLARADSVIE